MKYVQALALVFVVAVGVSLGQESVAVTGILETNCGGGEEGVPGIAVNLTVNGSPSGSDVTDSDGVFSFSAPSGASVEIDFDTGSDFLPVPPVSFTATKNLTFSEELTPTMTMYAPADVTVSCGSSTAPSSTGMAVATSYCPVTISVTDTSMGNLCEEEIERTFTASNGQDTASVVQFIRVIDVNSPTITVPTDVTLECGGNTSPSSTGQAVASDNCTPVTVAFSDTVTTNGCVTSITRTWAASDACGNISTAIQSITEIDTTTPTFVSGPVDYSGDCGSDSQSWYENFAYSLVTDNCSTPSLSMAVSGCVGNATVSAADGCGNFVMATCSYSVTSPNPNDPSDCDSCWFA
mmetsp:Transcript_8112/g.34111  ORF Transcript_8112/g.34111 Transcript_8112/m.34111 type:complete len:351 (+) Transcript_8112:68-1120(+)|eukprot:CAMPEP_0114626298 /NCGR_PEP_ID=MMETSP0168-20121206/11709_1 /TAXON_ID=95228 ORGANISM="Vannella sp., Strain DIVA3 517/6/12" /NCGR_SAMPLE_ID=MMETSP0168 /ASSEMBLY_ACC=CAM_ASM_000044 /LENGTH=350 /DNA_ID=CAMNT_0001837597 /DNA_START=23 /DNA_END=1075 /DNA_ORIENTATION=-